MQSIEPEFSSISLESQSIGVFTSSQPSRSQTACASSRSNPVYSPFSSIYPYGGYSASNPTVKVFCSSAKHAVLPIIDTASAAPVRTHTTVFFIIDPLFLMVALYHVKPNHLFILTDSPVTVNRRKQFPVKQKISCRSEFTDTAGESFIFLIFNLTKRIAVAEDPECHQKHPADPSG